MELKNEERLNLELVNAQSQAGKVDKRDLSIPSVQ